MAKDDFKPVTIVAEAAGVSRRAISTWVKLGLLPSRKEEIPGRNFSNTLVSVAAAKALAKVRKPGRPRKK
jgi:hypothetical protein